MDALPLNFEDLERAAMALDKPTLRSVEASFAGWSKIRYAMTMWVQARTRFKLDSDTRQSIYGVPLVLDPKHRDDGYTMVMSDFSRRFVAFSG